MNSYSYIEQLFTSILKQSVQMQGRFFIIPKSGSELNSDDLDLVTNFANDKRKYPLVVMTPPKSSGDFAGNEEWEKYNFTLFFLNTTYYDGNNQGKSVNPDTQTSQHKVLQDWEEMKVSAVDFLRILREVEKGNNSTSSNLINSVFRLAQEKKFIDPVSFQTSHRLSGVRVSFNASVYIGCTIQDYVDGGFVVLPPVDESTFDAELIIVRNEVVNILNELGLSTETPPVQLTVTADGQTQFNIFQLPEGVTTLRINGVTYYEAVHYNFQTVGLNTYLIWLNSFLLSTADEIFYHK